MSFLESRINWAFAFSPKTTYFVSLSRPVAVDMYLTLDSNQSFDDNIDKQSASKKYQNSICAKLCLS
jgi:hypothetical protein